MRKTQLRRAFVSVIFLIAAAVLWFVLLRTATKQPLETSAGHEPMATEQHGVHEH